MAGLEDDWRHQFDLAYRQFLDELRLSIQLALATGRPLVLHVELHPGMVGGEAEMMALIEALGDAGAAVGGYWVGDPVPPD